MRMAIDERLEKLTTSIEHLRELVDIISVNTAENILLTRKAIQRVDGHDAELAAFDQDIAKLEQWRDRVKAQ